jgi:hypothetical protein
MRNRDLPGKQVLLWVALIAWLSVLFAPVRISNPDTMRDFEVFWTAASRAAAAKSLYRVDDGHFQFKYLPAFAVLVSPASRMTLDIAKGKWLTVSIALVVTLIWLSVRLLPDRRRPTWFIVVAVVVAMAKFYGHELTLGQVNLAFAVLVAAGMLMLGSSRPAMAVAAFVAAVVVKPYAVLFLPWVALRGGWRAIVSATIGMAAVFVAPVGLYGVSRTIDLHRDWWDTVTTSTMPNLTNPDNVSVAAFAAKWLGVGSTASIVAAVVSLALLGFTVFIVVHDWRLDRREVLEGALLMTLVPLISPQGWDYVFLVATPAIALLVNYDVELPRVLRAVTWITIGVIGLSLYDLLGRQGYRAFMEWSVITLCFVVVLAALGTLRARRVA